MWDVCFWLDPFELAQSAKSNGDVLFSLQVSQPHVPSIPEFVEITLALERKRFSGKMGMWGKLFLD